MNCPRCGQPRIVGEYGDGSKFYACACSQDDASPNDVAYGMEVRVK